jgi:hypothetical protein
VNWIVTNEYQDTAPTYPATPGRQVVAQEHEDGSFATSSPPLKAAADAIYPDTVT